MPLTILCPKCKKRYQLSEEERRLFHQIIKSKEQLDAVLCPTCQQHEQLTNKENYHD